LQYKQLIPRDTMLAQYMVWPDVSFCPSVTSRYCIKTAKRIIKQSVLYGSL